MIKKENKYFIMDYPQSVSFKNIVKFVLTQFCSSLYKIKMDISRPVVTDKKYDVSICAIFKNEAIYLKEWIEFNRIVGIDHFYMYNNNSEDDFIRVLQPYINEGIVTLIDWPHNQMQMESYKDCIRRFSAETKWIGFIDIDEFIVPKSTDTIYEFLRPFEKNRGAVKIYWKLFGTSGRTDRNVENLVVEDFTVCWSKYCDIGKCFYNTAYGFDENSDKGKQLHHMFWARLNGRNIPPVNIFDKVCLGNINKATKFDFPIQINHYFTKSYKEYALKKSRGDVYFNINPHDEAYFYEHEMKCMKEDYSAYKYLIKLKLAMMEKDK